MSQLSFENTEIAFKGKSNAQLNRSYWLFKIIASPTMVAIGGKLTHLALTLRIPFGWIIKHNIFAQFCGGENVEECKASSMELAKYGIGTILDYSIEGKTEERDFDATAEEIIRTVHAAKGDKNIPFCVFKVTGIARFELLERQNEVVLNDKLSLSQKEQEEWDRVVRRVHNICKEAHIAQQRIFIDAEDSWIQDAIDVLCHDMMLLFNHESPIVYNTVQLYRHDRLAFLAHAQKWAKENGVYYGVKLVRGAYMEKERKRAQAMGYRDPIQPNKEATDQDFNSGVQFCLDHLDHMALCCGSHNEESSMLLAQWMEERGIVKNDNRVAFAQLFGMSDHISYNLADAGYNVVKYLPYGPIKEVMPYLLRRAQENTSVKGQTSRELGLILKERKRRAG